MAGGEVAGGVERAEDVVGLEDAAVFVDGFADDGQGGFGVVADLDGVEAVDLPEVGSEEVVALVVGPDGLAAGVPGVAVEVELKGAAVRWVRTSRRLLVREVRSFRIPAAGRSR